MLSVAAGAVADGSHPAICLSNEGEIAERDCVDLQVAASTYVDADTQPSLSGDGSAREPTSPEMDRNAKGGDIAGDNPTGLRVRSTPHAPKDGIWLYTCDLEPVCPRHLPLCNITILRAPFLSARSLPRACRLLHVIEYMSDVAVISTHPITFLR